MALKATIFKAELQIADTDRNYYRDHALSRATRPRPMSYPFELRNNMRFSQCASFRS